ncbi:MAG: VRR-NUC domain-containing protein [Lachnospiraceae bacterium]|nr:VRR-NUC domain-containing protein [Lachnospiraceae bacterium]
MREIEHNIQVACITWFRYQFPSLLIYAVPNGGQRNAVVAAKLKAEGAMSGVADLVIVAKNRHIYVEMKAPKGTQSPKQVEFEKHVKALGHTYYVCHSIDEFMQVCKQELCIK